MDKIEIFYQNRRNNLKELEKKYTRRGLDEKTGKSYGMLGKYLTGRTDIGEDTARIIEEGLGLPEYWLDRDHTQEEENQENIIKEEKTLRIPIKTVESLSSVHNNNNIVEKTEMINHIIKQELEEKGVNFDRCFWWQVKGESMSPTYKPGVWVIVDENRCEIVHGKFYFLNINNNPEVRRIYLKGSQYEIVCDNPDQKTYRPETFEEISDEMYIGRIVWSGASTI